MDNQDYLNKIMDDLTSAQNSNKPKLDLLGTLKSPKFRLIWFLLGGLVFIALALFGASLYLQKKSSTAQSSAETLYYHATYDEEIISDFQKSVKSSALRGYSASLNTSLLNLTNELTTYLEEKYSFKPKKGLTSVMEKTEANYAEFNNTLYYAQIAGKLDATYAQNFSYEIATLLTEAARVANTTTSDELAEYLTTTFIPSLETLEPNFTNFTTTTH